MGFPIGQLVATVLGGAIVGEINRKRAPEQKAMIGSGTAPSLDSGVPLEIQEILGTQAKAPEEASQGQEGRSLSNMDEEMLLQMLLQEQEGIMGMYGGGMVPKYNDGGGILSIFDNLNTMPTNLIDLFKQGFTSQSEEVQDIIKDSLSSGLLALIRKREEPRGSQVSTRTLPAGNANRRRFQFEPIGMNNGGATGKTLSDADMNQVIEMLAMANSQQGRRISDKDREFYSQLLEGATLSDLDIANLLAQPTTQMGKRISDKDREYQMSLLKGMEGGGVLNRQMFKPMLGGGELDGPGGPKDDLIPIMASDGEFMLSKATVDMLGDGNHSKGIAKLNKINNKGNRMYG